VRLRGIPGSSERSRFPLIDPLTVSVGRHIRDRGADTGKL
jgi:hypothetical protein